MRRQITIYLSSVILLIMLSAMPSAAQTHPLTPVIVIYSPFTPDWGFALAELVENDVRFDAEVLMVEDKLTFQTIVNFPRVQAVILCPLVRPQAALDDISDMTVAYYKDGGAVLGIGTACNSQYAPRIGPEVFSIGGNRSLTSKKVGDRRVFSYYKKDVIPGINDQSPDTLDMEGYLAFYTSNAAGEYVPIPTDSSRQVLYVGEKDVPLAIACTHPAGGRSVAFPGLTVQDTPGRDNYYGLLLEREEFKEIFLNSLYWALNNSPRFPRLRDTAGQALDDEASRRADLAAEADRLEKRVEFRRTLSLAFLWAVGLAFCAIVGFKLVIVRN